MKKSPMVNSTVQGRDNNTGPKKFHEVFILIFYTIITLKLKPTTLYY